MNECNHDAVTAGSEWRARQPQPTPAATKDAAADYLWSLAHPDEHDGEPCRCCFSQYDIARAVEHGVGVGAQRERVAALEWALAEGATAMMGNDTMMSGRRAKWYSRWADAMHRELARLKASRT